MALVRVVWVSLANTSARKIDESTQTAILALLGMSEDCLAQFFGKITKRL